MASIRKGIGASVFRISGLIIGHSDFSSGILAVVDLAGTEKGFSNVAGQVKEAFVIQSTGVG
ncbi:MAG: hypothetical protein AMR96_03055 [Candidatus Adiutrix intracellularis]|jgi:hypothetical protein|nr:MAG: hypothetical protein AMR96_03055 [Candidatus Adiutrix intracellularis]